jgi:hypothetical protein
MVKMALWWVFQIMIAKIIRVTNCRRVMWGCISNIMEATANAYENLVGKF